MLRLRERKGFTLIELMIVIAIIAILAAIAIPQYNAYRQKAKAKELVAIARACAQDIISQCMINSDANVTNDDEFDSCGDQSNVPHMDSDVTVTQSGSCDDFTVTANATLEGGGTGTATCSGSFNGSLTCTLNVSS